MASWCSVIPAEMRTTWPARCWHGSSCTQRKARAGAKKPTLLNSFRSEVTLSLRVERRQSNSFPAEESSSMPRVGSMDNIPF